jgi:hypothetical protein
MHLRNTLRRAAALAAFALLATALPWAGSHLPATSAATTASFAWPAFLIYALIIVACVAPFVRRLARRAPIASRDTPRRPFPWWGWIGVFITAIAWVLAWTRFAWFAPWQRYTFTPLWLGYVLTINALTFRRSGHCLLRDRPGCFAALFPASAAFWWYFEYIDHYVGNWHYIGVESFGPAAYFMHATISFSTVLPAVAGTREWLTSYPRLECGLANLWPVRAADTKALAAAVLVFGMFGFFAIGAWPRYFYAMVWVAPVLILVSLQALTALPSPLTHLVRGDWRGVGVPAVAALVCGFFWELCNWQSLAHWEYSIPFVQRFPIFEMPLLGYAGYLPFGIACAAVADLVCGGTTAASSSRRG